MSTTTKFQTFVVRPKISLTDEDPVSKALGNYKMSKFAGCPDNFIGAVYDRDLKRYVTGLDENHPSVLSLSQEEMIAKQKEIVEERTHLEKELGVTLHHTNEEFWSNLDIKIDSNKIFSTANPLDRVILKVIEAGKILPFSKEDCDDPTYNGINFYIGKEYEDVEDKNKLRGRERQIARKLDELLENFSYAIEIGKYLSIAGISEKMPQANLEDLLSDYLEKKSGNKDLFLDAVKEKREFIQLSNLWKEFKAKRLVEFSNGVFYSGKVALGKTDKLSVKKLLSADPVMQAELARLMEDNKEK